MITLDEIKEFELKPDSYWYDKDSKKETILRLYQELIRQMGEP